ncbi:hypothetical protein BDP81DRAFT_154023 [Colletotrichum phormii]|uniref:Uncharacterized protein n=1 Tax=Colletotrichum phormii TaxID=359342 RepID=A0AAJ0E801_9PEZI|nr:uncharacterized protein BDP81DRAFT_154023 [Colletotrichum phormii]KAK1622274.1 hypothetical protein BDP81DRAFT_154023 [Colletotrichum phormii]
MARWRLDSLRRFWLMSRRLISTTRIGLDTVRSSTVCSFTRLRLHDLARPMSACIRSSNCSSRQGQLVTFREGLGN